MHSFRYGAGSGKQYAEPGQPEQVRKRTAPVPGMAGSCTSDTLTALHTVIQGGGEAAPPLQYHNAVNICNSALGNRNFLQFVEEHLQPGRQQYAHVPPAAPLQMMLAKKKKTSGEEWRQEKPDQAARLGEGQLLSESEKGQNTGPGKYEDLLHALGTEASLNPPGLGRQLEEIAAATPGKVATLRDLAAAASVSGIADVDTALSSVQAVIDRLMGDLDLALTNAITDPSRAAMTPKPAAQRKEQAEREPAGKLTMKQAEITQLRMLAADPDLQQILEAAELLGYEVGSRGRKIYLVIGGMAYRIRGQIGLLHRLFFDDDKHVVFGWGIGNEIDNKPEALGRALAAHRPLLGNNMSVYTGAYQADWLPDIIQRHFGELSDPGKVVNNAARRIADADSYVAQAWKEGVDVDAMIKETMPGKEAHIRGCAEDITSIIEDFKASPEIMELLLQRAPLVEDFTRHIERPQYRKRNLVRHLEAIRRQCSRMYAGGTDKRRRAKLVYHFMADLEAIAADCMRQDPDTMQQLFGSGPADAGLAFYQRLFGAIADYKSAKYLGAQEYEFERFSAMHDLIYVYSSRVGAYLTGACRRRVGVLVARPYKVTGVPISVVLPELGQLRAPPASAEVSEGSPCLFSDVVKRQAKTASPASSDAYEDRPRLTRFVVKQKVRTAPRPAP